MASKTERTLIQLGNSRVIAMPHDWCEGNGLRPGAKLEVLYDEDVIIRIANGRIQKRQDPDGSNYADVER